MVWFWWLLHCYFKLLVPKLLHYEWLFQTILKRLIILGLWTWIQWLNELKANKIKWYRWSLISDKAYYNLSFSWTQLDNTTISRNLFCTHVSLCLHYSTFSNNCCRAMEGIETNGNIGAKFVWRKVSLVARATYGIIHLVSAQNFPEN